MPDNVIVIYQRIQSQNTFHGAHWRLKDSDRKNWIIRLLCAIGPRYKPGTMQVKMKIVSYRNKLILDKANLIGGAKGLVDAIVNVGLLYDDSDKYADITYKQYQVPRAEERTEIIIEDFEPHMPLRVSGSPRPPLRRIK